MGREFELKFSASEEILEAIGAKWGPFQTFAMKTEYYDTPGRELSRKRMTLRRRMENDCFVCTCKAPAPGGARGEWETRCPELRQALPELQRLGAPLEPEALSELTEICGAEFTRRARTLEVPGGRVEIALDRGFLLGGGKRMPLCEVEVELKEGPDGAAEAFARSLAETYGLQPEHRSKFARAAALAEGE